MLWSHIYLINIIYLYLLNSFVHIYFRVVSRNSEIKMPNFCCDNAEIVRKQREELILLTKDLKEQEIQLNSLHGNNLKQREKCKSLEKQKSDLEKVIKSKSSDIENLSSKKFLNDYFQIFLFRYIFFKL